VAAHERASLEEHAGERPRDWGHRYPDAETDGMHPAEIDSHELGRLGVLHQRADRLAGQASPEKRVERDARTERHDGGNNTIGGYHGAQETERNREVSVALEVRAPD